MSTPDLGSRWPHISREKSAHRKNLTKIEVALEGKLPPSPHAQADMLDAKAAGLAKTKGLAIENSGDVKLTSSKKAGEKLSRVYWAGPAASARARKK